METTNNKLNENEEKFFKELSEYLNTKLFFYGSVQRKDYFPENSDIDIVIFTDNVNSIIIKLQHFLDLPKNKFKKTIWRLNHNNRVVYGTKVEYKEPNKNKRVEISIYDEKYKKDILKDHLKKIILPFYAIWMLQILKFLYYKMEFINQKTFSYIKRKIVSIGSPGDDFIVLKSD
jgi:predicted nucleotidyltransferase